MHTELTDKKVAQQREQIREVLYRAGYAPHEAEARLSIAQTHFSDFTRPGGLA